MNIISKLAPAKASPVFDAYWQFAAERQSVFFRRIFGKGPPWTEDHIIQDYKCTNAYRASDRVSQYLISEVIYCGEQSAQEIIFRILLFKTFNKIETWEYLCAILGGICYREFDVAVYDKILESRRSAGATIYSGAYIMHSGKSAFGCQRKHSNHLRLISLMMEDRIDTKIEDAKSLSEIYDLLIQYPTIGSFLAYQYTIDINYSPLVDFSENEFVVPGPGAIDGISKVFVCQGGLSEVDLIWLMQDRQEAEFERLGLDFMSLWGRPLQLIDCQNLFCEISKYSRISHPSIVGIAKRSRIKQKFKPQSSNFEVWYPPKWGLNEKIKLSDESNFSSHLSV